MNETQPTESLELDKLLGLQFSNDWQDLVPEYFLRVAQGHSQRFRREVYTLYVGITFTKSISRIP